MKQIKKQNLTTQNDQGTPYLFTLRPPPFTPKSQSRTLVHQSRNPSKARRRRVARRLQPERALAAGAAWPGLAAAPAVAHALRQVERLVAAHAATRAACADSGQAGYM